MIVTEEEAKTKVCCGGDGCGTVAYDGDSYMRQCIGSACMAWRWKRGNVYTPDPIQPNHFTVEEGVGEYSTTHGYCGKAGKP